MSSASQEQSKPVELSLTLLVVASLGVLNASAATRHSPSSRFTSYESKVMCGYQGWFRANGDGSGEGWQHFVTRGRFDAKHLKLDLWPDVSEYPRTYPTPFKLPDGSAARLFSSWDASTVDLHFRWMKDYGIDGAFMQRFFRVTRSPESRAQGRVILGHALRASRQHGRALAVMYDLSGLKERGEDCSSVIEDWKELVDELRLTSQGTNQTYLYHRGKPLVAIWGLGFVSRPYDIRRIGIEKLIRFLRDDPEYGGCSLLLGVPTYFRDLRRDTVSDSYLHELIAKADVIMPWMVGRFTSESDDEIERYKTQVASDIAWCRQRNLDYAPCVYPGFSWHNLSRNTKDRVGPLGQIPRQRGRFYWSLINAAVQSGAKIMYVAMFDEIDEGTAIFKCSNQPPQPGPPARLLTYEGLASDHYLWLTGLAGRLLRGELPPSPDHHLLPGR